MTKPTKPVGLLSCEDAAAYLSIGKRTFERLVADGKIKRRRIGAIVRYSVADLDAYIESLPDEPGRNPFADLRVVSRGQSQSRSVS